MAPAAAGRKVIVASALSIVVVNFKSSSLLRDCLEALYNGPTYSFETWVVDNGSEENLKELQSDFSAVRWILNSQNLGFAKAVNQALRVADGKYFLLLNPDARIEKDALREMIYFLESHPDAGIVGGNLVGPDGRHDPASHRSIPTPLVAFYRLSGLSSFFPRHPAFGRYNLLQSDPNVGAFVEAVSGACMMLRRTMLDEIGLLDERFFLYGEDLDLCYRAGQKGWKVYYLPEAKVVHLKGGSSRKNRTRSHYEFHRAMAVFHRKHFAQSCGILVNALIYAGIWGRALLAWPSLWRSTTR